MEAGTLFEAMQNSVIPPGKWYTDPNLAKAYFYMVNSRFEEAATAFESYLRDPLLGPGETVIDNQSYILIDMAYCLDKAKRSQDVVKTLQRLPERIQTQPKAAYLLGCALAALGRNEEACEVLDRAKLDGEEAQYWQECRQLKTWLQFME